MSRLDVVIDGKRYEAVHVKDTAIGSTIVRVDIGQGRWRTARKPKDGDWHWDHSR